jgi:hypothetical protein
VRGPYPVSSIVRVAEGARAGTAVAIGHLTHAALVEIQAIEEPESSRSGSTFQTAVGPAPLCQGRLR